MSRCCTNILNIKTYFPLLQVHYQTPSICFHPIDLMNNLQFTTPRHKAEIQPGLHSTRGRPSCSFTSHPTSTVAILWSRENATLRALQVGPLRLLAVIPKIQAHPPSTQFVQFGQGVWLQPHSDHRNHQQHLLVPGVLHQMTAASSNPLEPWPRVSNA